MRSFNSCVEVKGAIDAYFKECEEKGRPLTITGLSLALGVSRMTLLRYEEEESKTLPEKERECICDTIKKAKLMCENFAEEGGLRGSLNVAMVIFNLKNNYGWKDKTELGIGVDEAIGKLKIEIERPKNERGKT